LNNGKSELPTAQPGFGLVDKAMPIVKKSDICVHQSSKKSEEYRWVLVRLPRSLPNRRRNVLEREYLIIDHLGRMKSLLNASKRCISFHLSAMLSLEDKSHAYDLAIQNHEEHERRWAQGTFLQIIKSNVNTKLSGVSLPTTWRIWLSMNQESDATAIWLERKFDVPSSGQWASEIVFSIPLIPPHQVDAPDFPGLIVFECTPLEGVTDDLEKFDSPHSY
jgi:hypothetical protein